MSIEDYKDRLISDAQRLLNQHENASLSDLVSMIKKVNPTPHAKLDNATKDRLYSLKTSLQNQLLSSYGALFTLEPVPWDDNLVLLRYNLPPYFDACHIKVRNLTHRALRQLDRQLKKDKEPQGSERFKEDEREPLKAVLGENVIKAKEYISKYDYEAAKALLSELCLEDYNDLSVYIEGIRVLVDDLGDYDIALEMLRAIPERSMNYDALQLLAKTYWFCNRFEEARSIFERCPRRELSKESLYRYGYILYRAGEWQSALQILIYGDSKDGYIDGIESLKKEIKDTLQGELNRNLRAAADAFERNDFLSARKFAQEVLRISSDNSYARDLLSLLQENTGFDDKGGQGDG